MLRCPIQVSANGRHFCDADGTPVFWLGDTQWELFRLFTPGEARMILDDRLAKGVNVVLVMLTGVLTSLFRADTAAPSANLNGEQPWDGGDPLKPNEAYFRHVDAMIRLGAETGQTLVVGVYHQWHVDTITLEKARPWARWVAQRYRDVPNLMWSMYPKATAEFVPVCRELAEGLREGDGGSHPICVHPDPAVASSSFMHMEPWLEFNMIQTCIDFDRIPDAVTHDYRLEPTKPVVMAEGAYEGEEFGRVQTPHDIRKQAWWTQLSGGHFVYGHNDAWMWPREWGMGRNVAARSVSGDWMAVYAAEPAELEVCLESLSASEGGLVRAEWVNPATGARVVALPTSGALCLSDTARFATPHGWEDAVLLVWAQRGCS